MGRRKAFENLVPKLKVKTSSKPLQGHEPQIRILSDKQPIDTFLLTEIELERKLNPGSYSVEVWEDQHQVLATTICLVPKSPAIIDISHFGPPAPVAPAPSPAPPHPSSARDMQKSWGWGLFIPGASTLVTGAVLGGVAFNKNRAKNDKCSQPCSSQEYADAKALAGEAYAFRTAAILSLAIGGTATAVGTGLLLKLPSRTADGSSTKPTGHAVVAKLLPLVSPTVSGLWFQGSW